MCGRYSLTQSVDQLRTFFHVDERPNLQPRWNIAPTQIAPVVRLGDDGQRHLAMLRWGLVPGWAKDLAFAANAINARAESVAEKPTFKEALRRRRCLVPADGYYEWMATGKSKQPYRFVAKDGGLLVFAGLWERWEKGAEPVETFGFVTVDASPDVMPVHDRMPVLLAPEQWSAWLDPTTALPDLLAQLNPAPAGRLDHYPVSPRVNSARVEGPDLVDRAEPEAPRLL